MSSAEVSAVSATDKNAPAPVGMVTHLKHLIESLPVCVMRADLDGCLLAVNDSALYLLGVTEHAKVLGKSLSERMSAEHVEDWRGFLARGWTEGASSVECEFVDFNGAHRIIFIKAVAQPMHADGIQSLILTAQDLASRRRLERALNEHQGCATRIDGLQAELKQSDAERQRLVALLETLQTDSGSTPADHESGDATLTKQIEELQGALAAQARDWQKRCDELTAQLDQRVQLSAGLEERAAEQQRLLDASAERDVANQAAAAALRERIAELEHSAATHDQEWQTRCRDLTAELASAADDRQKLSTLLEERDAERQRLASVLEERDAEHQRLSSRLEEGDAERQRLTSLLEERNAEHQRLLTLLEQRDTEHQRVSLLLEQHDAEHQQLSRLLEQRVAELQTAGVTLQQRIDDLERSLKAAEQERQTRCDDLTAQLAEHAAARLQLTNVLAERDGELRAAGGSLQQKIDDLERARKVSEDGWQKRCDELTTQLAEASAERQRLAGALEQHSADRQSTGESLQQRIAELERALKANEEDWQKRRADLTSELAAHVAEHERLSALLKQRDEEHQQLSEALRERDREHQRVSDLLKQRETEQQGLSDLVKQHETGQQRVSDLLKQRDDTHQAAVESLQQQIAECERALTANDEAWKQRCEELASQLTAQDEERKQRWEQMSAQVLDHAAERQRLSELLEKRQAEQQRLIDDHVKEKVRIEQTVRGECERAHADIEGARRQEIAALQLEMQQLAGDLQRTAEQLADRTAEYERLTADVHDRDAQEQVDRADVQRLMKSVAAYRIELVQVTENTIRTLEPMATAGRVAIASSRELQAAVEAVDVRSKQLLEQCALDDVNRPEIERLRGASIGAASLVRQLLQVFGESARSADNGQGETA